MSSLLDTSLSGFDVIGELLASKTIITNDILHKDLRNLAGITELVVPEGVKSLECSFGTTRIRKIVLPRSLDHIHAGAFNGATDLEEVVFPVGCKIDNLEYSTFGRCYSLRKLDLSPTKIRTIDGRCFAESGLEEIILPKALSYLGDSVFIDCKNLRGVIFRGRRLKTIRPNTFQGCTRLEEIELPDTVDRINDYAFAGCWRLRRVIIPGCRHFEAYAFRGASDIEELVLPHTYSYTNTSFDDPVRQKFLHTPK